MKNGEAIANLLDKKHTNWKRKTLTIGTAKITMTLEDQSLPIAIKNSPSHTTSPPTYAFPSIFAIPKRF